MNFVDLGNMDESVDEVAKFLDKDKPGWAEVLVEHYGSDLSGLRVSDFRACVFSAIYGIYARGADRYAEVEGTDAYMNHCHVFNSLSQNIYLRASWLRAVNQRLSA